MLFTFGSIYGQSGAKVMFSGVSAQKDYFDSTSAKYSGWELRLDARLGARTWFFAPSIAYQNTNILGAESLNPFEDNARLHTLKIPIGLGCKIKTAPFSRIFVKAGLVGNYVLLIDENPSFNFEEVVDTWASSFFSFGYDLNKFSIDYRYEQSLMDNFFHISDSKSKFHVIGLGINF
jgi:hypothetical protein